MRAARWAVAIMTGIVVGGTFHELMFGDRFGLIFAGLVIATGGIMLVAVMGDVDE